MIQEELFRESVEIIKRMKEVNRELEATTELEESLMNGVEQLCNAYIALANEYEQFLNIQKWN